ncbi:hypothetical protein QSV34_12785 [Porticoccus sp. W117]|uniref:hypothetical protein n=1 Tax=Porticoccus sp. W117 TaxID=3054777 RepID=UPI00259A820F|nr:hypothetical protein [Porticoccus sp. W117]MDM3872223.1 hypothetical protein [Porticoccus sp. W117]
MNRSIQTLCYFLAGLSFLGGLLDIFIQLLGDQEILWRIPLILIGIGVGIPIIIFPFYAPADSKEDYDDNDLSTVDLDGPRFMGSSSEGGHVSGGGDYGDMDGSD